MRQVLWRFRGWRLIIVVIGHIRVLGRGFVISNTPFVITAFWTLIVIVILIQQAIEICGLMRNEKWLLPLTNTLTAI